MLVFGIGVLLLNIDTIARIQINKALNRYLVAGGQLETVDIHLLEARIGISGLVINPPPGFGPHPLLSLDVFEVDLAPLAILKGTVVIEDLAMRGLSLNIVRDKTGRLSLLELVITPAPDPASSSDKEQGEPKTPWMQVVHVNAVTMENLSFRLVDRTLETDWSAGLRADLAIQGLRVEDLLNLDILLDRLDLTLNDILVDQPEGFSREPLLAVNKFEVISEDIDLSTSEITIRKVGLDTLSVSLERNADREVNLLKLVDAWLPLDKKGQGETAEPAQTTLNVDSSAPSFELPAFTVDSVQLASITVQALDIVEGEPWRAGFDNLDVELTQVAMDRQSKPMVSLATFDLDLTGIAVDQPPGFDTRKLFSLERFKVVSHIPDSPSKELLIKQVLIEGLSSYITMRSDGVTNIGALNEALLGSRNQAGPDKGDAPVLEEAVPRENILPTILFEQISLDGGPVTYRDEVFAGEPLEASLSNIQMEVNNLRFFSDMANADPASASLSFEFDQPGNLPTAYFGTLANVGPVGNGAPMVNGQARLVGLKLDTLGSLVPPATRKALGATGIDAGVALALDGVSINLKAGVLTDRDITYEGLSVQGPIDAPVFSPGPLLTSVLSRVSDGLVNLGKSGLKSSADIAEGVVGASKELGSGAAKVVKNLGESLFGAVAGTIMLDKKRVKDGISGTTKGTVDLTTDSVKGSGKAAGGSLKSSASELKGEERVRAWEQEIPTRYQTSMQHAQTVLAEMPYPPVTE